MAQTFMIFEFGTNEELAQQARHRLEGWKQGFRLGKKLELKFERVGAEEQAAENGEEKKKAKAAKKDEEANSGEDIRLIIRLDFSDHEKLSFQRWLDRIPTEEPFKSVKSQIIRAGENDFEKTTELFETERNYSKR
jgi:hypothetical protein